MHLKIGNGHEEQHTANMARGFYPQKSAQVLISCIQYNKVCGNN